MPQNGYTIGQDCRIYLYTQYLPNYDFPSATSFNAVPTVDNSEVRPFTQNSPKPLRFMNVWNITIEGTRDGPVLDDYWDRVQAGFYSGEDETGGGLIQVINEPDGSVSKYIYTNVILTLEDPGTFRQSEAVNWRLTGRAGRKEEVPFAGSF